MIKWLVIRWIRLKLVYLRSFEFVPSESDQIEIACLILDATRRIDDGWQEKFYLITKFITSQYYWGCRKVVEGITRLVLLDYPVSNHHP